ncbi:MAG: ArdC-like ssDNA-binding domain-containing protein [Planctomycetota bacterium]|jgi:antirestriction protein ArdC
MKPNLVRKVSEQAFSELVEAVEAGKSQKLVEYLKAMGRFHQYSLGNTILISFQKPNAMHVAGFRTWQKLGRHVKKGEHGIAIMAPIVWRKKVRYPDDQEDKPESEEETAVAFKTAYVFDVSQTDGKPLPEFARVNGDPGVYTERLREYISSRGVKLKYSDAIGSAEGLSAGGLIMLKKGLTAAEEFSVLIHEAAHEILHRDKENRPKEKKTRETEAEAVAFVVCHGVGLDTNTASSDYIQLYNGDKETLVKSLERIQRTASEILEAVMDTCSWYAAVQRTFAATMVLSSQPIESRGS